jgi:hypothetical protein
MSDLAGKVWTSELNSRPDVRPEFDRSRTIRFYDTTLRDGEQTVGVIFSPQQKLEIAKKLDELGVGRIEAGFPKVSAEDGEAISLILRAGLKHSEVWGFARATRGDVEELVRLGLRASVIETPISDIKLKAYGIRAKKPCGAPATRFVMPVKMEFVSPFSVWTARARTSNSCGTYTPRPLTLERKRSCWSIPSGSARPRRLSFWCAG